MSKFTKPSINWATMQKLVPPNQKAKFMAFKAKSEGYLRRMEANPPKPPPIKWEEYKKAVPVPGLVDKLKSAYESFQVPYPEDKLSSQVDEQWKSLQPEIKKFCDEQNAIITKCNTELDRIKALPAFEDMTMEMFYDMFPDIAIDSVNRPTFWPHTPEEQEGYVPPAPAAAAAPAPAPAPKK